MVGTPLLLLLLVAAEGQPGPQAPAGPGDKKGPIDYQSVLNDRLGKGVTPEKNANVLLWKAIGPRPEGGTGMPAEFFKRLGIEEPPERGDYLIGLHAYIKDHLKLDPGQWDAVYDQQGQASARPWAARDYPRIAAWLKANEKPLAVAVEATRRPDYFNPLVTHRRESDSLISALVPGVQKCREIASALTARAMLRVAEGKLDEAWQDLLACHRLGRLVGRGATLIESLVGIAIHQLASEAALAYLDRARLTGKQAQDRLKDLQSLPPLPSIADKIDLAERFAYLDSLQLIRRGGFAALEGLAGGGQAKKPDPKELKALATIDWGPALRGGNHWYDRLVAALRVKDRAAREKELDRIEADLKTLKGEVTERAKNLAKLLQGKDPPDKAVGKAIGDVLITLLMPATRKVMSAADRAEQVQRNLHLAVALAAYHHDHGRYPAKLGDLAPKYAAAVPDDLFSGKSLVYRLSEKGYLLYSVGANGKDEGGRWYDDDPAGDDPRVRMPLPELKRKK